MVKFGYRKMFTEWITKLKYSENLLKPESGKLFKQENLRRPFEFSSTLQTCRTKRKMSRVPTILVARAQLVTGIPISNVYTLHC